MIFVDIFQLFYWGDLRQWRSSHLDILDLSRGVLSSFWLLNMKRLVILKKQQKKTSITWRKWLRSLPMDSRKAKRSWTRNND